MTRATGSAFCVPCQADRETVGEGPNRRFLSHQDATGVEFCQTSGAYLERIMPLDLARVSDNAWPVSRGPAPRLRDQVHRAPPSLSFTANPPDPSCVVTDVQSWPCGTPKPKVGKPLDCQGVPLGTQAKGKTDSQ